MITPWEIYWVLQLDNIGHALAGIAFCSFVVTGALTVATVIHATANPATHESMRYKAEAEAMLARTPALRKYAVRAWVILAFAFPAAVLIPSTKTAAAMIIVPQIVNSPTIQHEAGDLYKLAKEALRDAIAPDKEK